MYGVNASGARNARGSESVCGALYAVAAPAINHRQEPADLRMAAGLIYHRHEPA